MVNQIQKPEYSITADQQARIIQSQKIGTKVSSIMSKAVNQIIDEITNQDEDIEKSFDYILSGLVQTFYYQKQNRDKWNMGIHSKLKNLERMSKEEINRLDLIKEMDKKISNTIVINFVKPIIEKLSKDYLDFYDTLRKKGLDDEASDFLDNYKKNIVDFTKNYKKIFSKLM